MYQAHRRCLSERSEQRLMKGGNLITKEKVTGSFLWQAQSHKTGTICWDNVLLWFPQPPPLLDRNLLNLCPLGHSRWGWRIICCTRRCFTQSKSSPRLRDRASTGIMRPGEFLKEASVVFHSVEAWQYSTLSKCCGYKSPLFLNLP